MPAHIEETSVSALLALYEGNASGPVNSSGVCVCVCVWGGGGGGGGGVLDN